eukprot:scaffold185308_cov46-Cyclotella_meneghiniana.AAC.1
MPNKKKGKKKAKAPPSTASTKPSSSAAASPSESIHTNKPLLDNVSPLLFNTHDPLSSSSLPFIGPIAVSTSSTTDIDDDGAPITSDNTAAAVVEVVHGRGLIVTRDVSAGECLFVIPSILSCHVEEVHSRFMEVLLSRNNDSSNVNNSDDGSKFDDDDGSSRGYGKELEKIAENVLVESVQSLQTGADYSFQQQQQTLQSFMSQMNSEHVPHVNQLDVLLAQPSSTEENQSIKSTTTNTTFLDSEIILNIIRRNAFGPDYHSYDTIAKYWMDKSNTTNNSTTATATTASATVNEGYNRLLGVYPLAAMINHSCNPNAVRIFGTIPTMNSNTNQEAADTLTTTTVRGQEVMIVHANTFMKKGTEITWSYLPPTTPYHARREMLQSKYGFTCQCVRCTCEEKAMKENYELFHQLTAAVTSSTVSLLLSNNINTIEALSLPDMIQSLENCFTSQHSTIISNEASRYIRVGYASLYMQYFNMALSSIHHNNNNNYETTSSAIVTANNLLQLATQLHFSFVSCNNASTEHISILHLCYELASLLHTRSSSSNNSNNNNNNSKNTMVQIKFWTEQLKQAHMIRYGALGEDLECVRKVMKHTRVVLRNRNGWYMVEDRFI